MKTVKIIGLLGVAVLMAVIWFLLNNASSDDAGPMSSNGATVQGTPTGAAGLGKPVGGTDASKPANGKGTGKPTNETGTDKPTSEAGAGAGAGAGKPAGGDNAAGGASGRPGSGGRARSTLVVSEPATEAVVNDRLNAVGSGKAVSSVNVVPLSAGTLVEVLVTPGQQVEKGDVLARLDDEEQIISRDRAARTAQNAVTSEKRLTQLFRTNTASAVDLDNAKAVRADADLALREAELRLQRRNITAPISGIVGLVAVDTGNYVTGQTQLITIDDRSTIIVEFWVPERFANQVNIDQAVAATALANPGKVYKGVISGIDSRIETDSRTLPVEARLDNSSDSLRPGMSFELQLSFTGQKYPAVNPLAVQWDSKGSFVWSVVDAKAQRVPVTIIQRNPESVLVDGDISVDDQIVTEGLLTLRPGAQVRVQGAGS